MNIYWTPNETKLTYIRFFKVLGEMLGIKYLQIARCTDRLRNRRTLREKYRIDRLTDCQTETKSSYIVTD